MGTFGFAFHTNLSGFVQPDSEGFTFPEWVVRRNYQEVYVDPHTNPAGPDGMNIYVDVYDRRPRLGDTDFDGDGVRDNARANENGTIANAYRSGHALVPLTFININPNILMYGNLTTWGREYTSSNPADAPEMHPELANTMHGGIAVENATNDGSFPFAGVRHDGTVVPTFGNWRMMFNALTYALDNTMEPKHAILQAKVNIVPARSLNPGAGTAFNVYRWTHATAMLTDGYYCVTDDSDEFGTTVMFDEMGTINTGVTGLFKGWLIAALSGEQRFALHDTLYGREFQGGWVGVNESRDTPTAITVGPGGDIEAGIFKRITGSQDPSYNDGSVVNDNIILDEIDGIFLERI